MGAKQKKQPKKDLILYTGKVFNHMIDALEEYMKEHNRSFRIGIIYDKKRPHKSITKKLRKRIEVKIPCNPRSMISIQKALLPYQDQILAITCRGEDQIPFLSQIVPHVPYLLTSSSESLAWSSDKLLMRRRLFYHNRRITPGYRVAKDASDATVDKIEKSVKYPLLVKPTGLAASRLVNVCYHRDELQKTLKHVFRKMKSVYRETNGTWEPKVVVEELMEGDMYSIDAYVNQKGKPYFCPMVHVKTGKDIGFDDFFGYRQMTPSILKTETQNAAKEVATEAIHALGLKNTTAHIEMMKTEWGWKIIEVGARIGGFRQEMYKNSFGINHTANDVLIRIPEKPIIPKKKKGYSAAMKFFAKNEGKLKKLEGIRKIRKLESIQSLSVNKKIGDQCTYAKHGGSSVFNVIMFNKERSKLLADIRRLEKMIKIITK